MKNLKNKIEQLGYVYKNELLIFIIPSIIVFIGSIILTIFLKNILMVGISLLFVMVYAFSFYFKYSKKQQEIDRNYIDAFINYFSFFRIYIANGESVYLALNKTLEFASDNIKPFIEGLISEIDKDKTIQPFIRFAANFKMKLIEDIMISVYEMVENGNNINYINQFTTIFENFKLRINRGNSETRFNKFDTFINSSLIGSGLIMIILVYGIINLIGEIL
jgi:hypothetical protein